MPAKYTAPGLDEGAAEKVRITLQERLTALTDLALTLKHIHWNVVGPHFIAVHEMLDPQYAAVQAMTDELAERIATLGGEPLGTPGAIVKNRTWDDYSLNRAPTQEHLAALDVVYSGIISDHRVAIDQFDDLDLGQPGHDHRPDRQARAVPLVRPSAPRGQGRQPRDRRRRHRAGGGEAGAEGDHRSRRPAGAAASSRTRK